MILDLLKSKRVWVVLISVVSMFLVKSGYVIDVTGQEAMADAIVGAVGAVGVIVSKIVDIKNSKTSG